MPVQSQIIQCPAGQWTAIAQMMESRRALIVQCPESNTNTNYSSVSNTWPNAPSILVAANPLRRSLMASCSQAPTSAISTNVTDLTGGIGIPLNGVFGGNGAGTVEIDDSWGEWPQDEWFFKNTSGGSTVTCSVFEEIFLCRSVVLGIAQTVAIAGPNGNAPPGIWTSPTLDSGPATFRLTAVQDADLVIQEWFAWPVGTGTVGVQVFQAFDLPPLSLDPNFATFDVGMPQLSAQGKYHLDSLRRKIAASEGR